MDQVGNWEQAAIPAAGSAIPSHPCVEALERWTIAHFGVGFYRGSGLLQGWVVIPIRDEADHLVAYAGHALDNSEPRYLFPSAFRKSRVLFHLHPTALVRATGVIVVEGFFGCMKGYQAGFPGVVALMGSTLSVAQEDLLRAHFQEFVLLLDGDAAEACSRNIAARLARSCGDCRIEPRTTARCDGPQNSPPAAEPSCE
jgi:DNA primase